MMSVWAAVFQPEISTHFNFKILLYYRTLFTGNTNICLGCLQAYIKPLSWLANRIVGTATFQ